MGGAMATTNFGRCLALVLQHEGGKVNNPKDPGGKTNQGVTKAVYDAFRKSNGLAPRDVYGMSDAERDAIYRAGYWAPCAGDELPAGVDYATFDAGVNSGVSRSVKWLQKALGIAADGKAGSGTIASAKSANSVNLIKKMCSLRMGFLRGLGTFGTFGKGWTRRVAEVEANAVSMTFATPAEAKVHAENEAIAATAASKAQIKTATATGGAGAATSTQLDPSHFDAIAPWLLAGGITVLVIAAVILIAHARANAHRAAAYAAVAANPGS